MSGLIGKKIGMTSLFDDNGKNIPCTVLEVGPCVVTQVRTTEVDGYEAVQLGFDDKAEKQVTKAAEGHFKKANVTPKKKLIEFQNFEQELNLGDTVTVEHFAEGDFVDVSGTSKGKGFQGVVQIILGFMLLAEAAQASNMVLSLTIVLRVMMILLILMDLLFY